MILYHLYPHSLHFSFFLGDKTFDLNVAQCFLSLMFRYYGNYRLFLTRNGFNAEDFCESLPVDYVHAVEIILQSQMWSVFEQEREELLKQGKLDSCVLVKTGHNLWHSSDLTVKCTKCGTTVTSDTRVQGGKIYCAPCFIAKNDGSCLYFLLTFGRFVSLFINSFFFIFI